MKIFIETLSDGNYVVRVVGTQKTKGSGSGYLRKDSSGRYYYTMSSVFYAETFPTEEVAEKFIAKFMEHENVGIISAKEYKQQKDEIISLKKANKEMVKKVCIAEALEKMVEADARGDEIASLKYSKILENYWEEHNVEYTPSFRNRILNIFKK